MWPLHSQGPSEQKPIKNFGGERGRIQGLPKAFEYPLLSQEMVKLATHFKFYTYFHTIDHNKIPLTISGEVAVGVVARDS